MDQIENTISQQAAKSTFPKRLIDLAKKNPLFIYCVVVPTIISAGYFGLITSDVYVSESTFLVKSPDRPSTSSIDSLLTGVGYSRSQDDSYAVQDFILSRDALKNLQNAIHVKDIYSDKDADCFSRFNCLNFGNSFESLYKFYQSKVSVTLDTTSSIITLQTRAFTPADSNKINSLLLEMSEKLVNQLNYRARTDMIRFANDQVDAAEQRAKSAALALASYRNTHGVIDPERQSTLQLEQVARLQADLMASQTALEQLQLVAKSNPQIPVLETKIASLRQQIDVQNGQIAGDKSSLADKAADYQRLSLERDFADKQLAIALSSLEQAQLDAQRKQLYIERIAQPSMPDKAAEPKRLRNIASTFVIGIILWGVLTILIAGVREHQA